MDPRVHGTINFEVDEFISKVLVPAKEEALLTIIRSVPEKAPSSQGLWALLRPQHIEVEKILIFCTSRQSVDSVHGFVDVRRRTSTYVDVPRHMPRTVEILRK